jgi:hypothetical protein
MGKQQIQIMIFIINLKTKERQANTSECSGKIKLQRYHAQLLLAPKRQAFSIMKRMKIPVLRRKNQEPELRAEISRALSLAF